VRVARACAAFSCAYERRRVHVHACVLPSLSFLIRVCIVQLYVPVTLPVMLTLGGKRAYARARACARGVVGRMLRASTTCPRSRTITTPIPSLFYLYDDHTRRLVLSSYPLRFSSVFPPASSYSLAPLSLFLPAPSWHALIPLLTNPPVYRLLFFFPCPSPAYYLSPTLLLPRVFSLSLSLVYVHSLLVSFSFILSFLLRISLFLLSAPSLSLPFSVSLPLFHKDTSRMRCTESE